MLSLKRFQIICLLSTLLFTSTNFAEIPYSTGPNDTIALQGADIVAYYTEGKYMKGSNTHQTTYSGTIWLFSSETNLIKFKNSPESFLPQYHGFSAIDVSNGKLTPSLPTLWHIHKNKLYFNHSAQGHYKWLKNKGSHIINGDKQWKKMLAAPKQND